MAESILVTGAGGFVGKTITELFRSKGFNVVTHARRAAPGIDWVVDLAELPAVCCLIPADIFAVVHCAAAIPSRSNSFDRDNNVASAKLAAMLEDATALRRIVHISSVAVYKRPNSGKWIISEDAEIVDVGDLRADPYARSKRASELALDGLSHRRPDVKVTHLRASSIYGPGMVLTTLLPALVARALRHEPLRLHGPRSYAQNFVHVGDVADLTAALILSDEPPSIVNVFSDDTHELPGLAQLVRAGLGSSSSVLDDTNDADAPRPVFQNARAKQLHPTFRKLVDNLLQAA